MQKLKPIKLGPRHNLSRSKAAEEYIVFRIRAEEVARLDFLFQSFKSNSLAISGPFPAEDLADTLRTAFLGWFASLIDKDWRAIYSFNCLYHLFPHRGDQIRSCQQKMESCSSELRLFRNNVAFHARTVIAEQIEARKALKGAFVSAVREFRELRIALEEEELNTIPELPAVLTQLGVAHLPAFARLQARVAHDPAIASLSLAPSTGDCRLEPDSCQMLDQ